MKCDEIRAQLSAYFDGELPAGQADAVRRHLDECPACMNEYKLLQSTWQMLLASDEIEPSADFARNFWRRLREENAAAPRDVRPLFARVLKWAPAMAASLLIAFLAGWCVGNIQRAEEPKIADVAFLRDYEMIQEMDLLENLPLLQFDGFTAEGGGK
ncbi:MAG TPA: zf-HC2 domain-containing protein [Planctomycetota bacterium]|nr:zf-HC2 domain-containing protein [Planctomycetota bacterium]